MPDAVDNLFRTSERTDCKYGPAGQLLEAWSPQGVTRYAYDAEGNLVKKIQPDGREWKRMNELRTDDEPPFILVDLEDDSMRYLSDLDHRDRDRLAPFLNASGG